MSIIGGFFKKTKHQKFDYKPRFWNPEKEDLENRIRTASGEYSESGDPEAIKLRIRNNMRRGYKSGRNNGRSRDRRSLIRLLVIIVMLVVLSYYILTVYLPEIEALLK